MTPGVFVLPCNPAARFRFRDRVFWNAYTGRCTDAEHGSGNPECYDIGEFYDAEQADSWSVRVRLDGLALAVSPEPAP